MTYVLCFYLFSLLLQMQYVDVVRCTVFLAVLNTSMVYKKGIYIIYIIYICNIIYIFILYIIMHLKESVKLCSKLMTGISFENFRSVMDIQNLWRALCVVQNWISSIYAKAPNLKIKLEQCVLTQSKT